jgi:hypothetical protein
VAEYYADSSVLVKRHVNEVGSAWIRALTDPRRGNTMATARLSVVEVFSALNRRRREARLSDTDYADIVTEFTTVCTTEYELIELTPTVVDQARSLLERYPLRASDAAQLASALTVNSALQIAGLVPLTLLAADDRLLDAARAEGLATDNPNRYP